MMYLGAIEGFYWVVRAGGFTAAARAFPYPITQPGVFRQVRELELALGVKLVEAIGKRKVVPTPEGRRLFAAVAPFIESWKALAASLKGEGELRVHASNLALRHVLPPWIAAASRMQPKLRVSLFELPRPELTPLLSGDADIVVDHFAASPPGFSRAVVGRAHAWLIETRGAKDAILYNPTQPAAALQVRALQALGRTAEPRYTCETAEQILDLVARGLGYSIVPFPDPPPKFAKTVRATKLRHRGAAIPIHAVWRSGLVIADTFVQNRGKISLNG